MASLFSVEGIEASGKTTVVTNVARMLRVHRLRVNLLNEFISFHKVTLIEEALKQSLFVSEGFQCGPRAAFLFMLYHEVAKLESSRNNPTAEVTLADRYIDSVTVYQGAFLPGFTFPQETTTLARATENLLHRIDVPLPAVSYLLDIPLDLAAERYWRREGKTLSARNRGQIERIRNSFLELAQDNDRFFVVDGSKPSREVAETVCGDILKRLSEVIRP